MTVAKVFPYRLKQGSLHFRCHYCEMMPVNRCYECSNVLCHDCYLMHDKLTKTEDHAFHSINDTMQLNNKFEVFGEIFDITALPAGLLVIALYSSDTLLTYSVSNKERHEISIGGGPLCIATVDSNTVAVQLTYDLYRNVDAIKIVDVRQRQIIQHVDVTRDLLFHGLCGMCYIKDQFYISNRSGIVVINMSGTLVRKIDLGFKPTVMCYDDKTVRIYYIDFSENKLICIDKDGKTIFTFTDTDLRDAQRLTLDKEGYLLILCHKDSKFDNFKVHRINCDGKSNEVIITWKHNNIIKNYFRVICFQEESDEVFIGIEKTVFNYKKID